MRHVLASLTACFVFLPAGTAPAADAPRPAGYVHNLKVLSDKVDDVSTVENVLKSFADPRRTDAARSRAIWTAVVKYRHQSAPPNEYLAGDWEAHDPIKLFNVYGYCMCCCSTALVEALNRLDGREARGRILTGHSVPEVRYGDAWHMYDGSLITFFPKPGGAVASVDEISEAVKGWYATHPGYRGDRGKLSDLMRGDGWTAWKSKGPPLLGACPHYTSGFFPARTHGWNDTMAEYDRSCEVYEYGYHVGHRAVFSLRPGESLVREAGNRGLHVNMLERPDGAPLKSAAPRDDLVYLKEYLPGYSGGVVANGYHRYAPDLAGGGLAAGAEVYDHLTAGGSPALRVRAGNKAGVAVVPLASPYVYLGGRLTLGAVRKAEADRVTVSISTNNGRSFTPVWSADKLGANEAVVDVKDHIFRRYAYWLKVELSGPGAGLEKFAVENDIQHAPRTLPWLGKGTNRITVAADRDPAVACRTVACRITPDAKFRKNESSASMGLTFENLDVRDGSCWWKGGTGVMTVPVEAPGDLTAVRFSTQFRARGTEDRIRVRISFDGGKTWRDAARLVGPTQGKTEYTRFAEIPPGRKKALLRYEMSGTNTVGVLSFRVDADYRDPTAGAFRPFAVVHRWKEAGRERMYRAEVAKLPFRYEIEAGDAPEMVSVSYEMAPRE